MGSVPNRSAYGLSKDKRGRLEINVVSGEMFLVLLLIVLESHDVNAAQDKMVYIQLSIHVRGPRSSAPAASCSHLRRGTIRLQGRKRIRVITADL